ncbi:MAG: galactokinase [Victivallales bacterium]|nr:galactokinase [Victivallales bacterium]
MKYDRQVDSALTELAELFLARHGHAPALLSRAPGRLEILGNHTDYNEGTVLSVAINRAARIAAAPNPEAKDGMVCRLYDIKGRSAREFRLDDLDNCRHGDWSNYIKGLIVEFNLQGFKVPAFDALVTGDVPLSAGMSSSAALEMAMCVILNNLSDARLTWLELAKIGQSCENNYVGAHTGLLDQISSLKGKAGQLIYSDFRSFEVENVPMPTGTVFVVANSKIKHNLTNEYNERREACEEAARILGVKALRDVSPEMLEHRKGELREVVYRRAKHVVGEIARVAAGQIALATGDLALFGKLMTESHESSRKNFENSCPEIDMLVEIGQTIPGFLGARISGGGFGGISVHLVQASAAERYCEALGAEYHRQTGIDSQPMVLAAADGATLWEY